MPTDRSPGPLYVDDVSTSAAVLNLAYLALVLASTRRQMIQLRVLLLAGSAMFVAFAVMADITSMLMWNALIGLMHVRQLVLLIIERRRASATKEEDAIRSLYFPGLDPVGFATLGSLRTEIHAEDQKLISQGQPQSDIYLILEGTVEVHTDGLLTARLGAGSVVGEMSRLQGQVASADCRATGPTVLWKWAHQDLSDLGTTNPVALLAFEHMVERDLVAKILEDKLRAVRRPHTTTRGIARPICSDRSFDKPA